MVLNSKAVNRRVASSNLARGAILLYQLAPFFTRLVCICAQFLCPMALRSSIHDLADVTESV
jgi:hypothetical protein